MRHSRKILLFFLLPCIILIGCKKEPKEGTEPPASILGKWTWQSGLQKISATGQTPVENPITNSDFSLEFKTNASVIQCNSGSCSTGSYLISNDSVTISFSSNNIKKYKIQTLMSKDLTLYEKRINANLTEEFWLNFIR